MLAPVTPYSQQRNRNVPQEGQEYTVDWPGERGRVKVVRVASRNSFVGEIISIVVSRGSPYKKGDTVCCRRGYNATLQQEIWEIVSDRELDAEAAAIRFEEKEREREKLETEAAEQEATAESMANAERVFAAANPPAPAPAPDNDWTC